MIFLMLAPLLAVAVVIAWAFWWVPRQTRARQAELARPQLEAHERLMAWHRQSYLKRPGGRG